MRTASVAFIAATLLAAMLTPTVRHLALQRGWLDHALTSRKLHGKPVPRLGGIAIVLAFYAPLVALFFVDSDVGHRFWAHPEKAFGLFAGGAVIALLGLVDDFRGANSRLKFAVQFGVAALMFWCGYRIDILANPFGDPIHLGLLSFPFTLLWIAGVINAMNLIDGLDGLAGGVALIAIVTTFGIAAMRPEPLMILFTAGLAGSVLGFLFYNFNPASIFMGDTGSMFLGFVLATTTIQTSQKASTAVAIIVPMMCLGLPITDTLLAMVRRAIRGAPLFSADRGHIHHRLLAMGLSQRQAVLVLYGTCILLALTALTLTVSSSVQTAEILLVFSGLAFLGLRRLGFMDVGKTQQALQARQRNAELRGAVRRAGVQLQQAEDLYEVFGAVRGVSRDFGAVAVALRLSPTRDPDDDSLEEGFEKVDHPLLRAQYPLHPERPGEQYIELAWDGGRNEIDRDLEIAIEHLCEHVAVALDRAQKQKDGTVRLRVSVGQ